LADVGVQKCSEGWLPERKKVQKTEGVVAVGEKKCSEGWQMP